MGRRVREQEHRDCQRVDAHSRRRLSRRRRHLRGCLRHEDDDQWPRLQRTVTPDEHQQRPVGFPSFRGAAVQRHAPRAGGLRHIGAEGRELPQQGERLLRVREGAIHAEHARRVQPRSEHVAHALRRAVRFIGRGYARRPADRRERLRESRLATPVHGQQRERALEGRLLRRALLPSREPELRARIDRRGAVRLFSRPDAL